MWKQFHAMVNCWCLIIEAWNRKKKGHLWYQPPVLPVLLGFMWSPRSFTPFFALRFDPKSTPKIHKKTTRPFCYDLLGRLPGLCWPPVGLYEIRGVVGFVADLNLNHSESNPTLIILIAWIWPAADLWSIHKMFLLNYFMILHATWSIHDLFARHQSMQDPACFPHRDRQWFVIFGVPYYPGLVSDLLYNNLFDDDASFWHTITDLLDVHYNGNIFHQPTSGTPKLYLVNVQL